MGRSNSAWHLYEEVKIVEGFISINALLLFIPGGRRVVYQSHTCLYSRSAKNSKNTLFIGQNVA